MAGAWLTSLVPVFSITRRWRQPEVDSSQALCLSHVSIVETDTEPAVKLGGWREQTSVNESLHVRVRSRVLRKEHSNPGAFRMLDAAGFIIWGDAQHKSQIIIIKIIIKISVPMFHLDLKFNLKNFAWTKDRESILNSGCVVFVISLWEGKLRFKENPYACSYMCAFMRLCVCESEKEIKPGWFLPLALSPVMLLSTFDIPLHLFIKVSPTYARRHWRKIGKHTLDVPSLKWQVDISLSAMEH